LDVAKLPVRLLDDTDSQQGEQADDRRCRTEGGRKVMISTRVERDPGLRGAAIRIHGTSCIVCGFVFAEVYGDWGEGYIEVHHLEPLGETSGDRKTSPERDLVVVCANCHRMIHRRRDIALSVDELRAKIDVEKLREWVARLASG
jgi:predicted HNH restriction endonuclease